MTATDKLFAGSIPEIYDGRLVPLIFEHYARDLAERVAATSPQHVLEIAAGTGALTSAITARLPAQSRIVATDLNQPMLDCAATRSDLKDRISWRQADALALPFEDQSFDVVACQFGVMFFPDKVKGYSEARRVLRPRGHFVFNVWDRISENEFADTVNDAVAALLPDETPAFLVRTPHGYCDVGKIRAQLTAAGFSDVAIETVDHVSRAASPQDAAVALCQAVRSETRSRRAAPRLMRQPMPPLLPWRGDLATALSRAASGRISLLPAAEATLSTWPSTSTTAPESRRALLGSTS